MVKPLFDKPVRPAALCRGVMTGSEKAGWSDEAELNGVEEEPDGMRKGTRLAEERS